VGVELLRRIPRGLDIAGRQVRKRLKEPGGSSHELAADRHGRRDCLVDIRKELPGAVEQRISREREGHRVRRACQELGADELLEGLDLSAQRRL
jgi:hypothetical protein